MRYAIIENGRVANVANAEYPLADNWIEDDGTAQIGGIYDGAFYAAIEKLPTLEEYEQAIDNQLNLIAKEHGYDNIVSACSYAGAVNPYQVESMGFIRWRGMVWGYATEILNNVKNGIQSQPTIEDVIQGMPKYGD